MQAIEHIIVLDFEATCDKADDALTRLQQCDAREIIEFVRAQPPLPNC